MTEHSRVRKGMMGSDSIPQTHPQPHPIPPHQCNNANICFKAFPSDDKKEHRLSLIDINPWNSLQQGALIAKSKPFAFLPTLVFTVASAHFIAVALCSITTNSTSNTD